MGKRKMVEFWEIIVVTDAGNDEYPSICLYIIILILIHI